MMTIYRPDDHSPLPVSAPPVMPLPAPSASPNPVPILDYWNLVSTSLNSMRTSAILTDVMLICGKDEFPAHRALLAAASPYFYTMFSCGLRETVEFNVELPGVKAKGLEVVLEILYSGAMKPVGDDELNATVEAAHLMQLHDIFHHYRGILLDTMRKSTFVAAWDTADKLKDDAILAGVFRHLSRDFGELHSCLELRSLDFERFRAVVNHLGAASGMCKADHVLTAIVEWTLEDKASRLESVPDLLTGVSFENLSHSLLSKLLRDCPLPECTPLREKIVCTASARLDLVADLEKVFWGSRSCILVLGVHPEGQLIMQRFQSWNWRKFVLLNDLSNAFSDAAAARFDESVNGTMIMGMGGSIVVNNVITSGVMNSNIMGGNVMVGTMMGNMLGPASTPSEEAMDDLRSASIAVVPFRDQVCVFTRSGRECTVHVYDSDGQPRGKKVVMVSDLVSSEHTLFQAAACESCISVFQYMPHETKCYVHSYSPYEETAKCEHKYTFCKCHMPRGGIQAVALGDDVYLFAVTFKDVESSRFFTCCHYSKLRKQMNVKESVEIPGGSVSTANAFDRFFCFALDPLRIFVQPSSDGRGLLGGYVYDIAENMWRRTRELTLPPSPEGEPPVSIVALTTTDDNLMVLDSLGRILRRNLSSVIEEDESSFRVLFRCPELPERDHHISILH